MYVNVKNGLTSITLFSFFNLLLVFVQREFDYNIETIC